MNRLFRSCATLCLLAASLAAAAQAPVTGQSVPSLSGLDAIMQRVMADSSIPGGALAVSVDGRLIYARGFGYARLDTHEPVQPDTRFRVASNSKAFTATAILKLIEAGKLTLATKPFATTLADLMPAKDFDPRLLDITVQNLLEHKGGWDDTEPGTPDPSFAYAETAAKAFNATPPATPELLVRYVLTKKLQHDPGTTYAYSNFGYITLGVLISRITGMTYVDYVQKNILDPAGLSRVRHGGTLLSQRLPGEAAYYPAPNAELVPSIMQPGHPMVTAPYGLFSLEIHAANGGWVSSAIDLVRFADIMNGQLQPSILKNPPAKFAGYIPPYGSGWSWHFFGSLPGDNSVLHLDTTGRMHGRITWSATFNCRNNKPAEAADKQIAALLGTITTWPSTDLFPSYQDPAPAR